MWTTQFRAPHVIAQRFSGWSPTSTCMLTSDTKPKMAVACACMTTLAAFAALTSRELSGRIGEPDSVGLQDATNRRPVALILLGERVRRAAVGVLGDDREFLVGAEPALLLFDRSPEVAVVPARLGRNCGLDARVALGNVVAQLDPFVRVSFRE